MLDQDFKELKKHCRKNGWHCSDYQTLNTDGTLIEIKDIEIEGWNRPKTDLLFVAPPAYPAASPDCFWVAPGQFRLANGSTPQGSSDSNPIPDDTDAGRQTTWFSWHLANWDPNRDNLITFLKVALGRLDIRQ